MLLSGLVKKGLEGEVGGARPPSASTAIAGDTVLSKPFPPKRKCRGRAALRPVGDFGGHRKLHGQITLQLSSSSLESQNQGPVLAKDRGSVFQLPLAQTKWTCLCPKGNGPTHLCPEISTLVTSVRMQHSTRGLALLPLPNTKLLFLITR